MQKFNRALVVSVMTLGVVLSFNNCGQSMDETELNSSAELNSAPIVAPINFSAASVAVQIGQSTQLTASGGIPPYTFSVQPGTAGAVDSFNQFQANQPGATAIRLTDASGNYREIALTVTPAPEPPLQGCTVPFGEPLAHNGAMVAWNVAVGTCASENRVCVNGTLSGSYRYASCRAPKSCVSPFNSKQTIAHGASVRAYVSPSRNCFSENRVCNDGSLSGSFKYSYCNESSGGSD